MTETPYISKQGQSDDVWGFDALKAQGLKAVQELCGNLWTDYNAHDPGVTLLEQAVYGLSELMYQTTFPTADYFTGPDGRIDFKKLSLVTPDRIFPARPLTVNDYRKVIFDSLPEVVNVVINTHDDGHSRCLYRIAVRLKEKIRGTWSEEEKENLKHRVADIYYRNRNLGEDLHDVTILSKSFCGLHAEIDIGGSSRAPVDILAEIYFACQMFIASGITFTPYPELEKEGHTLEAIFSGPFTRHGWIGDHALSENRHVLNLSDLSARVTAIEGVQSVRSMAIECDGKMYRDILECKGDGTVIALKLPEGIHNVYVRLLQMGRACYIPYSQLKTRYEKRAYEQRSLSHLPQNLDETVDLPRGRDLNFPEYVSIQEHFPAVYGINRFGVPRSQTDLRKAQVKQLKGYLYFFDQIIANGLSTLKDLPDLFSGNMNTGRTASFYHLDDRHIPEIEELYLEKDQAVRVAVCEDILRRHDSFHERKGKILDYLLALYGEKLPTRFLRDFNYYFTGPELEDEILRCKSELLHHIGGLNTHRGAGFNPMKPCWDTANMSGVERKAGLYLGLKITGPRSLVQKFRTDGIRPVPDTGRETLVRRFPEVFPKFKGNVARCVEGLYHPIPYEPEGQALDIARLFPMIPCLRHGFITESLLRGGIFLDRYKIGPSPSGKRHCVFFRLDGGEGWAYVADFKDRETAVTVINQLRRYVTDLHRVSEGFHLVEHVLLRPSNPGFSAGQDFYDFRVSIIFPDWPARFGNPRFRALSEDTLRDLLPSHVHPCFYWLPFNTFCVFESLYEPWLRSLTGESPADRDEASSALSRFFLENMMQTAGPGPPHGN